MDASDQTTTAYILGSNSRVEWPVLHYRGDETGAKMVVIQRCADHVMYTLNLEKHEYTESPLPGEIPKDKQDPANQAEGPPNLFIETTVRNTGDTKPAFGHQARHYIITTKQTSSPELGMEPSETVEDAWYLDVPDPRSCMPRPRRGGGFVGSGVGIGSFSALKKIHPEFKYSGPEPEGMILSSKRTNTEIHILQTGEKQENQFTTSVEVVEMSEEPLDPNLFQIPSGFKKVSQTNH